MTAAASLTATVVVPTHDHGATLLRSVPTALAQSVGDLEVLIVGDGVPPQARAAVDELLATDPRVRFFENPKGERHGEAHRHRALAEARGEIVLYLSDDDLWRPDHVASMRELLREADFAHTLPVGVDATGALFVFSGDLSVPGVIRRMLDGENFIPLHCAGHTLEAYRRLPRGWTPAPEGVPTDLYFFQQLLAQDWCRPASSHRPTGIHFPSPLRMHWTPEQRLAELDVWAAAVADDERWQRAVLSLLASVSRELAEAQLALEEIRFEHGRVAERVGELDAELSAAAGRIDALERLRADTDTALAARTEELDSLRGTATWRLRERLKALPLVWRVLLPLVRALAGRRAR